MRCPRPLMPQAQSPLIRFVVDLLYNKLYSKSTASPQQIELVEFGFRQLVDLSWHCSQSQRAVVSRDDYVIIIRHIVKTQ